MQLHLLVVLYLCSSSLPISSHPDPPQSVIVIDGGSTGTRAHIFEVDPVIERGGLHIHLPERSEKISPGISEILTDEKDAYTVENIKMVLWDHFSSLQSYLLKQISPRAHSSTPLLFRGTGGLRSLPSDRKEKTIQSIDLILSQWPFEYRAGYTKVLSGTEEGVYGWLLLNQLLGAFPSNATYLDTETMDEDRQGRRDRTVAMVEMGGASLQVVSEVDESNEMISQRNISSFPLGLTYPVDKNGQIAQLYLPGMDHPKYIYAVSYDGFGRQLAMNRYITDAFQILSQQKEVACLPSDVSWPVSKEDIHVSGRSNATECLNEITSFCRRMQHELPSMAPINLEDLGAEVFATENFYYFQRYVAHNEKPPSSKFSASEFLSSASFLCPLTTIEVKHAIDPEAAEEKSRTACFGLNYMSVILTQMLGLKPDHSITAANKIGDTDIAWPAGLVIVEIPALLEGLLRQKKDEL